jgi:hypothetical protein
MSISSSKLFVVDGSFLSTNNLFKSNYWWESHCQGKSLPKARSNGGSVVKLIAHCLVVLEVHGSNPYIYFNSKKLLLRSWKIVYPRDSIQYFCTLNYTEMYQSLAISNSCEALENWKMDVYQTYFFKKYGPTFEKNLFKLKLWRMKFSPSLSRGFFIT